VRALLSPCSWSGHDIVVLERTGEGLPTVTPIVPWTDAATTQPTDNGAEPPPGRRERMLRLGLYQQAERLTLVERELRRRIEVLEQPAGGGDVSGAAARRWHALRRAAGR